MATLSVIGLEKHFGKVKAVDGVNFRVEDGEFLCILGPSGCGKSTVLRMIAGFEDPTGGDIRIGDSSVMNMPANRRPTAMVFQKYTLWPHMKVYDNIAFGLKLRKLPAAEIKRKIEESLAMVGMAEYGERMPQQLSGGQQQRVALARAIVLEPKILLLDEPFSNLDALLRVHLREELRRIQQRIHITTIFVTHDQEEALTMADRIAVMSGGRLEQIDQPSNIYANPQTLFVADFIGVMNLVPGTQRGEMITAGGLNLPSRGTFDGPVTVAVRPEDLILTAEPRPDSWAGTVEQMIDLGHYRRGLISIPAIGADTIKVYLPKTTQFGVGDHVSLAPMRYLVYRDGQPPVEMHAQASETVASISRS